MLDVPPPPLDPENARTALADACRAAGLDATHAELIRLGENAVFRLREPVVARVARSSERLAAAQREVAVAHWLSEAGIPAIHPLAADQPIQAAGRVITLWESANEQEEYGSTAELGAILRELHQLDPPKALSFPSLDLFGRAVTRVDTVPGIGDEDRMFLRHRADQLADAYADLTFHLPEGVIHGDANVGNLLRDRDGHPLLMDLDGFATGPREWDLIQTAIFYDRFGWHTETEYREFVEAYGYDILSATGYLTLREIRELSMVCWLSQNVATNPRAAREFAKRMATLRSTGSAKEWDPL